MTAILSPCCTYDIYSQTAPVPTISWQTPLTNADTGVFFSWEADTPQYCASGDGTGSYSGCATEVMDFKLTGTSGAAIASQVAQNIPGQIEPVQPVLQAEDGPYVGTVYTQAGQSMIAFDTSGNVKWSVPNYSRR